MPNVFFRRLRLTTLGSSTHQAEQPLLMTPMKFLPLHLFKTYIVGFNAIAFTLPANLFYVQGISSIEIDFGDGAGLSKSYTRQHC